MSLILSKSHVLSYFNWLWLFALHLLQNLLVEVLILFPKILYYLPPLKPFTLNIFLESLLIQPMKFKPEIILLPESIVNNIYNHRIMIRTNSCYKFTRCLSIVRIKLTANQNSIKHTYYNIKLFISPSIFATNPW